MTGEMPAFIVDNPKGFYEHRNATRKARIEAFIEDEVSGRETGVPGVLHVQIDGGHGDAIIMVKVGRAEQWAEFAMGNMTPRGVAARAASTIDKHGLLTGGPLED